FLVGNLVEGPRCVTRVAFVIVWTIFTVNFTWEFFIHAELDRAVSPLLPALLVIFLLGIILALFEFIADFTHKDAPAGPICGRQICSSETLYMLIRRR
ncbi:MAG: hypothetical protein SGPRY_012428, partial [Prymnesium sp.]